MPPEICPHCGAEVPRRARACPECGSDEATGWSENAAVSDLGLPDEEFDYARFVEEESGKAGVRSRRRHWLWWGAAIGIVIALLMMMLGGLL